MHIIDYSTDTSENVSFWFLLIFFFYDVLALTYIFACIVFWQKNVFCLHTTVMVDWKPVVYIIYIEVYSASLLYSTLACLVPVSTFLDHLTRFCSSTLLIFSLLMPVSMWAHGIKQVILFIITSSWCRFPCCKPLEYLLIGREIPAPFIYMYETNYKIRVDTMGASLSWSCTLRLTGH